MHDSNNAGNVEIITFRAHRTEHPFYESLMALMHGTSTGHIALRVTFTDPKLYEKYIANTEGIIKRSYKDKKTNRDIFEVYFSFWPFGSWTPSHYLSILRPYKFDCEQSGNYCRFDYNRDAAAYFQPLHKYTKSRLPIFNNSGLNEFTLPPTIILHSSRLGLAYGDAATRQENAEVVNAAEKYVNKYHAWRTAVIKEQNAQITNATETAYLAKLHRDTRISAFRLRISKKLLKDLMFPNKALNDDEFDNELEAFISYGYPERDSVSIPLVYNAFKNAGIQIEPVLKKIQHIAQNPAKYPYNVLGTNCAKIVFTILAAGLKNTPFVGLKQAFILPWFVRWLYITLTPALILQCAIKLQRAINLFRSIHTETIETPAGIEIIDQTTNSSVAKQQRKNDYGLKETTKFLEFTSEKPGADALPTTRSEMLSKLLQSVSEYTRS